MSEPSVSKLPDPDMQSAPAALLRAAERAREIARLTGTGIVVVREGRLVEEPVEDASTREGGPSARNER